MNVLVVDVGGTHVKVLASGQTEPRRFDSEPEMVPRDMVVQTQAIAEDWNYNAVSIGYPGPVLRNRPVAEPHNLGRGWVGFDFDGALSALHLAGRRGLSGQAVVRHALWVRRASREARQEGRLRRHHER